MPLPRGARDDYKSNHEETEHESEVERSKEKKLKFHVLAVREDQKDNSRGTQGKPDEAVTILFREEPNPNVSRLPRAFFECIVDNETESTSLGSLAGDTLRVIRDPLVEPKKIDEALQHSSWIEAMQEELLQFKRQEVWTLVDLPPGQTAIGTRWVFRNKQDERGIVIKNKARLVAQDYTQEE
ncbi:hypothetical protein L1987_01115 [Smallanthus sonchifolius]|uniref:Uncharacterized protein n=1 Tax=Smallanthus sonchifolius TaxID=185202 RepID=A0ACB9K456_9ASTR|nr:hypothetical protein L1987_01115 [Smallanthus sonchifolius]